MNVYRIDVLRFAIGVAKMVKEMPPSSKLHQEMKAVADRIRKTKDERTLKSISLWLHDIYRACSRYHLGDSVSDSPQGTWTPGVRHSPTNMQDEWEEPVHDDMWVLDGDDVPDERPMDNSDERPRSLSIPDMGLGRFEREV